MMMYSKKTTSDARAFIDRIEEALLYSDIALSFKISPWQIADHSLKYHRIGILNIPFSGHFTHE